MKRYLLLILSFFLLGQSCWARQNKEQFLDEVAHSLVRFRFRKLYIRPTAESIWNNYYYDKKEIPDLFKNVIPEQELAELYENARDTTIENWDCKRLTKTKCVPTNGKKWSKKGIGPFYSEARRSIVRVSKPFFTKDGNWTMISAHVYSSAVHGYAYGYVYGFHKVNGKWKNLGMGSEWIT